MYEQVIHYELPEQLAQTIKKGSENAFAHIQNTTWHLLAEHSDKIHVNSSILNLCYIQGEIFEHDNMGLAMTRAAGAISFEMAGTVRDTKQHGQTIGESMSGIESVPSGKARIYIGKTAFESLIEATFDDSLGIGRIESSVEDPIQMAVEDLEDLMPGISNVFNEDNEVNISAHIDNIIDMKLDGDEENI